MDNLTSAEATADRMNFGIVVLAAGGATRMGQPKQLLPTGGKPLILRAVEAALASRGWPVIVVLGANAADIRPLLAPYPVLLTENPRWAEGMGTSVQSGIALLNQFSRSIDAVLLALCDQPYFSTAAITALERACPNRHAIAAARYAGSLGAPALFGRAYFEELAALNGPEGARRVIAHHDAAVTAVDLPELAVDLDTPEDYRKFIGEAK